MRKIETSKASNNRNYGIDALRIYSMLMIVVLHILSKGGILENTSGESYYLVWFLEIFAYCAADSYALISGYVRPQKRKERNFIKFGIMWTQVVFYSFGVTALFYLFHIGNVSRREVIESIFPVASTQYWYFTAYVGLLFLIPVIDFIVDNLSQRECNITALVLITVFSIYGTFSKVFGDPFLLADGYSVLWLCILYFLGAWMKKYNILDVVSGKVFIVGILLNTVFVWICFCCVPFGEVLVSYISPFVLLNAVFFLRVFSRLNFGIWGRRVIAWISSATFGVYLIHCQKVVFNECLKDAFLWVTALDFYWIPIIVLLAAVFIFILCVIIEKIRIALFGFLRIERMIRTIDRKIREMFSRISQVIKKKEDC